MSISNYVDVPVSMTVNYVNGLPVVNFHDKWMKDECAELMFADHDNNVFVFQWWSEIPFNVDEYHATILPRDISGHVIFFIYIADGRFDLISRTTRLNGEHLRNAFKNFGFDDVNYHSYGFDEEYVKISEKDTFKLKMKVGR